VAGTPVRDSTSLAVNIGVSLELAGASRLMESVMGAASGIVKVVGFGSSIVPVRLESGFTSCRFCFKNAEDRKNARRS
jgi:hypothetical protein